VEDLVADHHFDDEVADSLADDEDDEEVEEVGKKTNQHK
jgi:hypothetical protein